MTMEEGGKPADGDELHRLFRAVFALHRALAERMDAVHGAAGLGTPEVKVLDALSRLGAATVPEVASDQAFSRQFALTVCRDLERAGLIVFSDNPRHRRSKLASLTEAGKNVFSRFRKAEGEILGSALPDLDARVVKDAGDLLREITRRVEGS